MAKVFTGELVVMFGVPSLVIEANVVLLGLCEGVGIRAGKACEGLMGGVGDEARIATWRGLFSRGCRDCGLRGYLVHIICPV